MGSAHRAGWFRGECFMLPSAAPPLVAGAITLPPPIQGALWVLGGGVKLSLWQQRSENHTTGLRPEENKPTALSGA